ncbi:MAG: PAS domain S-box protein, partial [Chloroflexota bacterium]
LTDITTERIETLGGISGLRSDGQEFPIEASISQIEAEGKKYFTVILRDVTERKQAEQGLARLAAIVTSSNDAIISQTLDRTITSWNQGAERIFGYSADEVIGKLITILIPPHKLDEEAEFLQKIYADETVKHFDTIRLKKDGSEVFVSVSLAALKDSQGKIVGITKIAQNITERKQAEAKIQELNEHLEQQVQARTGQLLAVNKNLDSFAYVVSHDLKAPLRGITQLASWLAADYAESLDDEGRNMLNLVVGRTKRMHEMIEGILQYSRIGRVKENLTKFDLNRLVADVVDLLAAPESIAITVAADLPMVYGDEIRIRQVFQNLIGNAIKYMDKPIGKIGVRWSDQQTNWQFAIADTGPGIAPQYHEKIFQIFQTLAPRDEVESTGIGLALVEKIVQLHKGRVWLESIEGQGTTFYFTLPKTMEEISHEE